MSRHKTFIDLAVTGAVPLDGIDDCVEVWHRTYKGSKDLASYLGLTDEEYALWVGDASVLPQIVDARRRQGAPKRHLLPHP